MFQSTASRTAHLSVMVLPLTHSATCPLASHQNFLFLGYLPYKNSTSPVELFVVSVKESSGDSRAHQIGNILEV